MNRRHFLQRLGLASAGMGLGTLGMRSPLAAAGETDAPKRLLIVSHCHGWPYEAWKIHPTGLDTATPWELPLASLSLDEFSAPLAPLHAHRERLIAIDGLSLATAERDVDGNRHDTGWVHAWTGDNANFSGTDTRATSASIDQIVAAQISRADRLPSLELSVDVDLEAGRPISYAPTGVRLPVLNTPDLAWQRMFGPSLGDVSLAQRQRGVLDFAYAEYQASRVGLSTTVRDRLEAHFALLAGLGDRIEGMAALQCEATPQVPATLDSYDHRFDTFADLIAAAFSCDITRVATLSLGEMPTADFGWDHLTDNVHKGLAHEIYNDPQKHQAMTDYLTHHAHQMARLVALLEATPDVDGRSVMDNTLIVWGSELGDGWHGYQHYCPTLIGGSWHFNTGRYLHMPHSTPIQMLVPAGVSSSGYSTVSGRPHQHLLVSTAQAMGIDTQRIGIDVVQGQTGEHVSCTGPLTELQ